MSKTSTLRWLAWISISVQLSALAACGAGGPAYNPPGTPVLIPPSAAAPGNPQADLLYARQTQEAASVVLTDEAMFSTQAAQKTESVVHVTQVELDQRLKSSAATSTQAYQQTQDSWTAEAIVATRDKVHTQDAATAQVATESYKALVALGELTQQARATQAVQSATATAVQAGLDAQTEEVKTWGPIIFVGILAATVIVFAWRLMSIFEARKRVIPQPNGAPLIIQEQRASLEKYLPNFLRWIAWFLETQQVIVDQEKNLYPVTVIGPGIVRSPKLTDDDRQERVTRRRQFTQTVAALAGDRAKDEALALASEQTAAIDDEPRALPPGGYEIVDSGQFNAWLSEVKTQLLPGAEQDGETDQAAPQN